MRLEIQKTTLGTVRWIVREKTGEKRVCPNLSPSGNPEAIEKGWIPVEFSVFQLTDCKSENNKQCRVVQLQHEMP